jgi:hypothetical protein
LPIATGIPAGFIVVNKHSYQERIAAKTFSCPSPAFNNPIYLLETFTASKSSHRRSHSAASTNGAPMQIVKTVKTLNTLQPVTPPPRIAR